jgi:glycosyltransferase involved in cell wall biosynthesis
MPLNGLDQSCDARIRMKVLVVHNYYQQPGGERVSEEAQVALLRERGHKVILYTRDNAEIKHYRAWEKAAFFPRTVFSRRTFQEIRDLVTAEQPDVAHVHNVFPLISPSVYRALKDAAVPIVQTVYNFRFLCPNGFFYTQGQICERCKYGNTLHAVRFRCYRQSYVLSALYALVIALHRRWGTFALIDHFTAPAEFTAHKLVEGGLAPRKKITVLGYFLPDPLPVPGSFKHRKPYVAYLGRLSEEKGLWTLLDAVAGFSELRLKVLGEGPLADSMRRYVKEHHLTNVEMVGFVSGEAKWDVLREALAVVVPSEWYENSPFVALESLAAGTPVVTSDLGSLPDVVDGGKSGLLFRPGDSQDLRQKLTWLVAHPEETLALGHYGRQVAETQYSAEAHYRRLMTICAGVKR